jgi:hypothetical protein
MNTLKPKNRKPFIITKPIEAILRAVHFYRYMSSEDLCRRLLYSPKSITYVREILSSLSGGADFKTNQYLYRFQLPSTSAGSNERIYTLGSKGRDFIANDLGEPVDFCFRPHKLRHLSYSQVLHNLILTRFLVSAHAWAAKQPDFRLNQTRICYELAREAATIEVSQETLPAGRQRKTENLKAIVIPDAWIEFEKLKNGDHEHYLPVLLEIDRGSEYKQKYIHHLLSRLAFIKSGEYK